MVKQHLLTAAKTGFFAAAWFLAQASSLTAGERKLAEAPLSTSGLAGAAAETLLGSYLAGRVARDEKDHEAAAKFYRDALLKDPSNAAILAEAFQLALATGNRTEAKKLALRLTREEAGHFAARLFLGVDAFTRSDYKAADKFFSQIATKDPVAALAASLGRGWTQAARNNAAGAMKTLRAANREDWAQFFIQYNIAMVADGAGDQKLSRPAYALAYKQSRSARVSEAYARHAAFWAENELAEKILAPLVARANPHPIAKQLLGEINAGAKPRLIAATPQEGLAEAFYGIGEALSSDSAGADVAVIYLQFALFLSPDFALARYSIAEQYEAFKSYGMAISALDKIPQTSVLWFAGQMRKASHFLAQERNGEAETLLKSLLDREPQNQQVLQILGNILRHEKKYGEAIAYYSQALNAADTADKRHWPVYYNRGIAYERSKLWTRAEADFKKALELDSDQAQVLNYLGYSWVDQNSNIREAMDLIKKAVALKPNDGFYVDSLGWAYYRQRDYERAVLHLDRAVELQPQDPVINDHLGDAFWRVGRKREARYQWSMALTLKPEPEDETPIKRKLQFAKLGNDVAVMAILNQDWVSNMTRGQRSFAKALAKHHQRISN